MWKLKHSDIDRPRSFIKTALRFATSAGLAVAPLHAVASLPAASNAHDATESEQAISALNNAISIVTTAEAFAGVEYVKSVLCAVGAVLTMVRDTMTNKNDFVEIGGECAQICVVLKRGTFGKKEEDISPSVMAAISDLRNIVKDIQNTVTKSAHNSAAIRAFNTKMDTQKISRWRQDLNRILLVFNTELQIINTITTDEINEQLHDVSKSVKEGNRLASEVDESIRDARLDIKEVHREVTEFKELYKASIPDNVAPSGEHPPPAPRLFFGRDDLVQTTVNFLIMHEHVALVGVGGIGKTSIARAALNDATLEQHFGDKRYFARCDDFATSRDNFLNRISHVVGAKVSQSNPLSSLRAFLSALRAPLLLVLDNAETVLDAPMDKAEIADVIDELGSYTYVALVLTTRDATLPCNVVWNRIDVPPLDFEAARDTFSSIYRIERPSATSDALLNRVDFHPLSINLLAWAGAQNRWSLSKLAEQWECEKIRLLDLGKGFGKARSLSISIELSMNSPTMQDLGEAARHVLQVIAFFPTGVNQNLLLDLFPSLPTIRSIVDTLNKLSLTVCHDDFITMLMPIRLHLQKNNSVSPLLEDVRTFYYRKLGAYGSLFPGDEGFNGGTWILCEHDNVEKLIAYDLAGSEDSVDAYRACADFLVHLFWHRPRHTTLKAMVLDTSEESSLAVPKATCLQIFGWIATDMGNHAEATELLAAARSVSLSHGERWRGTQCSVNLAEINRSLENLLDAEEQFTEAKTSFRDLQDLYGEARCNENLGDIARRRGNASEASRLLSSARAYYESVNKTWNVGSIRTRMGILEFDRGDYLKGREHFEAAIAIFMDIDDMSAIGWCLKKFAKAETTMGHWTEVHDLLEKARGYYVTTNCFTQAAQCLMEQGRAYGFQKEFSAAEEHLARSRDEFSLLDCRRDLAECTYISGLVKFDQGLHETAKSLWTQAREAFTTVGDAPGPADCARGLGEIAFAKGDIAGADTWFAEAKCKYEAMGLSQSKMNRHISMPRTTLGGWKLSEQGMLRSSS